MGIVEKAFDAINEHQKSFFLDHKNPLVGINNFLKRIQQLLLPKGLAKKPSGTILQRLDACTFIRQRGNDQNLDIGVEFYQFLDAFQTIHVRHG